MKTIVLSVIAIAAVLNMAAISEAGSDYYSAQYSYVVNVAPPWSTNLTLPKFDPSRGSLTAITITQTGVLFGTIRLENESNANTTRTGNANLADSVTVTLPSGGTLVSNPAVTRAYSFPKFDKTLDYGGTSGATYTNLTANQKMTYNVPSGSWATYKGIGTLSFPVVGANTSTNTNAAVTCLFTPLSGVLIDITYDYTPWAVPEPSSIMLFLSGLLAIGSSAFYRVRHRG